jgi:hypothetical protein
MPSLSVAVPHALGREEAIERLKGQFGMLKDRFGHEISDLVEEWDDHVLRFGFTTYGFRVQGTVTSGESEVTVTAQLPLVAMPLKSAVERQIRGEVEKILG